MYTPSSYDLILYPSESHGVQEHYDVYFEEFQIPPATKIFSPTRNGRNFRFFTVRPFSLLDFESCVTFLYLIACALNLVPGLFFQRPV